MHMNISHQDRFGGIVPFGLGLGTVYVRLGFMYTMYMSSSSRFKIGSDVPLLLNYLIL